MYSKSEFHGKQFYNQPIVVCFHRHKTHSEYAKMVLSGVRLDVLMDMMSRVNVDEGEVGGARACCEKNATKILRRADKGRSYPFLYSMK